MEVHLLQYRREVRGSDEKRGKKKKKREGTLKFDFSAVRAGRQYLSAADEMLQGGKKQLQVEFWAT